MPLKRRIKEQQLCGLALVHLTTVTWQVESDGLVTAQTEISPRHGDAQRQRPFIRRFSGIRANLVLDAGWCEPSRPRIEWLAVWPTAVSVRETLGGVHAGERSLRR